MGFVTIIARISVILIITGLFMVILMDKTEAWVGGRLSIESPTNGQGISGKTSIKVGITGIHNVSQLSIYGKSLDTNMNTFTLLAENKSCGSWNEEEGIPCNVIFDTRVVEDSSIWQIYAITSNSSNPQDTIRSSTITNLIIDNTKPLFKKYKFLSPQDGEIVDINDISFGVLVNGKTVTHCFIKFTSNIHPGQREYKTNIEKNNYCNLTLTMPDGIYNWVITASDGKDLTDPTIDQKVIVRSPKDISKFEQKTVKSGLPESSNLGLIAIAVIFILILLGRRR